MARELTRETKRRWGVLGYPLSLWRVARRMRSFRADIRCDQDRRRLRSIQIWIGNGRHFGGGMTIAADARDRRWQARSGEPGAAQLLAAGPVVGPALRWGHHHAVHRLRHWRGTEIEIRTRRPMPINTDGEVTTHTPANVRIVPKALSVYVP